MRRRLLFLFVVVLYTVSAVALAVGKRASSGASGAAVSTDRGAGERPDVGSRTAPKGPAVPVASSECGTTIDFSTINSFGFYSDADGTAQPDESWTFDHGAADPLEGWRAENLTENSFAAFQRVDEPSWLGHGNLVPTPLISGDGSMWIGFHSDEAADACFTDLGYGNGWAQRVNSPQYQNVAATFVTFSFDYWSNIEAGLDVVNVYADDANGRSLLTTITGVNGSSDASAHFEQTFYPPVGVFSFEFEFISNSTGSDEDGLYPTTEGPFGFDNVNVRGPNVAPLGPAPPHNFEIGLDGWVPSAVPGVDPEADLGNTNDYTINDPECQIDGNVLAFHDANYQHPAGQTVRMVSPPVVTTTLSGLLNIYAEYDIFWDLPPEDGVSWTWGFKYFPYQCPETGESIWSPVVGPGISFTNAGPVCERIRSWANDPAGGPSIESAGDTIIPPDPDSLRFVLEVRSTSLEPSGNFTPIFDNIRIVVSEASGIIHVPSPSYPTIQSGVDAVPPEDTVAVGPGEFGGAGNVNINFDGKNLVLASVEGPEATVIDCEFTSGGFQFSSGETSASIVEGFKVTQADPSLPGGAIYVNQSSPQFRDMLLSGNETESGMGTLFVESGDPTFECLTMTQDAANVIGANVVVAAGAPSFSQSTIDGNTAQRGPTVLLQQGSSPVFDQSSVSGNQGFCAVEVQTGGVFSTTTINDNSGDGIRFASGAAPSSVDGCTINGNSLTGIVLGDNSSVFTSSQVSENQNGGIVIKGVYDFSATPGEQAGIDAAASLTTAPTFTDMTISGNVSTSAPGGGVLFDCANTPTTTFAPQFTDCTISGNSTSIDGGGVAVCGNAILADINPVFTNCTIATNIAGGLGGGIYSGVNLGGASSVITIVRTILWGNCASTDGEQGFTEAGNAITFDCSDVDASGMVGGGATYDPATVFEDPNFCEEPVCVSEGTILGDFTIPPSSAAAPEVSPCGQLIGAQNPVCTASGSDTPASTPSETALWQNTPNPFNPTTTIRFDLAEAAHVSLRVYDVRGRLVRTLVNERRDASEYTVEWRGRDDRGREVATGVYFLRLTAGSINETRKMVLLK